MFIYIMLEFSKYSLKLTFKRPFGQVIPFEMQAPIKPTPHQWTGGVFKVIRVDDVNNRSHGTGRVSHVHSIYALRETLK